MKHTLNPRKDGVALFAAAIAAVAPLANVQARSLIHYFDFDTPSGNGLAYTGVDKGTRPANFTLKGSSVPRTTGALSSDYAYYTSAAKTGIWLGDGSASLGCGTTQGFTISFWLKTSGSHIAWADFFGFRVGGLDYRCEYTTENTSDFSVYYNVVEDPATCAFVGISGGGTTAAATAGEWRHAAFVFTPNGTNNIATCALYVGGEKIGYVNLRQAGDLQQIHIGSWVRGLSGADRKSNAKDTGIDELAVFDYPVTAEQVKWLAKYKPAQPAAGPGRAMPVCWLLDALGDASGDGIQATNSGTGPWNAYKSNTGYANWTKDGALGSAYTFHINNYVTFRVDSGEADGFGATLGSGMTLSFWIKAPATITAWRDFMSFRLGDRYERVEWQSSNPAKFYLCGSADSSSISLAANTWQNVCMVWNEASSRFDFYLGGAKQDAVLSFSSPSAAEALKSFAVGSNVILASGSRNAGGVSNTFIDEVAIFNHSLSANQIAWLANNIPCLPPLDATNLVRTVTTSGAWAGGLASWGVREWDDDGGAWTDTTRTTIYPTLEDTEVEVAVAFAADATLSNDTFVTPKRLSVSGTGLLVCDEGSLFAPETLVLADGAQLTVSVAAAVDGRFAPKSITFGTGARIVFDITGLETRSVTVPLASSTMTLPDGESDVIAHFAVKGRPAPAVGGVGEISLMPNDGGLLVRCVRGLMIIFR